MAALRRCLWRPISAGDSEMTAAGINLTHESWLTRVAVDFWHGRINEQCWGAKNLWQKNDDNWRRGRRKRQELGMEKDMCNDLFFFFSSAYTLFFLSKCKDREEWDGIILKLDGVYI